MSLRKIIALLLMLTMLLPMVPALAEDEVPTIRVLYTKGGFEAPPEDDPIKKKIEEEVGVKLEWISPPSANYTEQVHATLASRNNLPDIVAFQLSGDVFEYASQGALLDLKPYLDLMPDITSLIPETAMEYFTQDGGLYAIPKWTTTKRYNTIVRKDWLDKLGLEVPKTLQDYHDVAYAFTYQDPDGNGVNDTYGLSGMGMDAFEYIFGAFGVICGETNWNAPDTHVGIYFYRDGDELKPMVTKPAMKEALALLRDWYAEGLIDPEFVSLNNDTFIQKFEQNRYGLTTHWWNWEAQRVAAMKTVNPDVETLTIAPPIGPEGFSGNRAVPEVVSAVSVMSTTKYPEECAKLLNYFHTERGMMTSYTGVEGVHWYETEDGRFLTTEQFDIDNKWIQWYFLFENEQPLYKVETYLAPSRREALQWEVIRDDGDGIVCDAKLAYNADLTALVASTFSEFITGQRDLETFDDFCEEFMAKGGAEWSKEITEKYNAKYGK